MDFCRGIWKEIMKPEVRLEPKTQKLIAIERMKFNREFLLYLQQQVTNSYFIFYCGLPPPPFKYDFIRFVKAITTA